MSDNPYIYQAMFLLDNTQVREQGFNAVRDWVKSTLEKHGATVKVLRFWGERQLEYPIQNRARATYVLGWIVGSEKTVSDAKHEMYLLGPCFRSLFLKEEEIPEEELAMGIEEVKDEDVKALDDTPVAEQLFEEDEEPEEAPAEEASSEEGEKSEDGDAEKKAEGEASSDETAGESGDDTKKVEA